MHRDFNNIYFLNLNKKLLLKSQDLEILFLYLQAILFLFSMCT